MNNDYPLIKNLKDYGFYEQLSGDELNYVFSEIFDQPVIINKNFGIYFFIYDDNGNEIYFEDLNNGKWNKREYNDNGNEIYYEDSDGKWVKREFNENGKVTYGENYTGKWSKWEYDERGDRIYFENSDGYIEDRR